MKGLVLDAVWEPKPTYKVSDWEQQTGKAITGNAIWRNPNLEVKSWPDPKPGPKQVLLEIQAQERVEKDLYQRIQALEARKLEAEQAVRANGSSDSPVIPEPGLAPTAFREHPGPARAMRNSLEGFLRRRSRVGS